MPATLTVSMGLNEPFDISIGHTASIGRGKENTVALPDNQRISRFHALLRCHDGYQYQIVDLGSKNGTYLNGVRVITPTAISDQALIRLGDVEILFKAQSTDDSSHADMTMVESPTSAVALMKVTIENFDDLTLALPEEELAMLLGRWHRETGSYVLSYEGWLDKFLRGSFIAYWPEQPVSPSENELAFDTAQEILGVSQAAFKDYADLGVKVRITLAHGNVRWPMNDYEIGAPVMGEGINTLLALEQGVSRPSAPIMIQESCLASFPQELLLKLKEGPAVETKGRPRPLKVFYAEYEAPAETTV
ncbi:MAG: FHA domain-containing protein [Verrucomicrobiales bacterium]